MGRLMASRGRIEAGQPHMNPPGLFTQLLELQDATQPAPVKVRSSWLYIAPLALVVAVLGPR